MYVGGGYSGGTSDEYLVFQYNPERDGWDALPPCPVREFALAQFQGHLITVGGLTDQGEATGKVYRYREESNEWAEYLKPLMPTARNDLVVISTQSAIIACGGEAGSNNKFATVEVYTAETTQWHVTDSLPGRYSDMTSVTIGDTCYLLGGHDKNNVRTKTVLCAPVSSLVRNAVSPSGRFTKVFKRSVWDTLPHSPLYFSVAASPGGCLLAVGGDDDNVQVYPAVHMFVCNTNSWVRMPSGDLPSELAAATAIELPDNKLLVCGGHVSEYKDLKTVYMGYITTD